MISLDGLLGRLDDDRGVGRVRGGGLAVDGVEDLLAVDGDFLGSDDPQPHLVAADLNYRDRDVVVDRPQPRDGRQEDRAIRIE